MISRIHIDHIRQQIELVDEELRHLREVRAGWQKLYDTAQALVGVPSVLPPEQPEQPEPRDGQTIMLPSQEPGQEAGRGPDSGAWEVPLPQSIERAHARFQAAHEQAVCGAEHGSTSCALPRGHEGDHDDMLGTRWPRAEAGGER